MNTAAFHVPNPDDEIQQRIAAREFEIAQLAEIHARQPASYTPDSDRTAADEPRIVEDPDPEC